MSKGRIVPFRAAGRDVVERASTTATNAALDRIAAVSQAIGVACSEN
jgi:hypothetical protein